MKWYFYTVLSCLSILFGACRDKDITYLDNPPRDAKTEPDFSLTAANLSQASIFDICVALFQHEANLPAINRADFSSKTGFDFLTFKPTANKTAGHSFTISASNPALVIVTFDTTAFLFSKEFYQGFYTYRYESLNANVKNSRGFLLPYQNKLLAFIYESRHSSMPEANLSSIQEIDPNTLQAKTEMLIHLAQFYFIISSSPVKGDTTRFLNSCSEMIAKGEGDDAMMPGIGNLTLPELMDVLECAEKNHTGTEESIITVSQGDKQIPNWLQDGLPQHILHEKPIIHY